MYTGNASNPANKEKNMNTKFIITGMTCSACSSRLERVIGNMEGVTQASVNLTTESLSVTYDSGKISSADIIATVEMAGFEAREQIEGTELTLPIYGMTCSACSSRLERVLNASEGMILAQVSLATETATIKFDPAETSLRQIRRLISDAGFTSGEIQSAHDAKKNFEERRAENDAKLAQMKKSLYAPYPSPFPC